MSRGLALVASAGPGSGALWYRGCTGLSAMLPHTRFDTTPLAAERRLETWREAIGVLFDVRPAEPGAAESPVLLDSWQFGPAVLCAGSGPGFAYDRSPRAIATSGLDMIMVQFYEAGRCRVVRGAPAVTSEPGDLVVTDLSRSMATEETAFRNVSLLLPRAALAPLLRAPDAQGGRVLRHDLPLVTLVRRHLEGLVGQAPRLSEAHAMDVVGVTAQLIAATLNGSVDEETRAGTNVALACEIRRFIDDHLDARHLTPEALMARFGLSRAALYRLFASDGGVRAYIQRRRLSRAQLDLIRPRERHRTAAEIGEAAGYAHAQDFVRAYRREFGVTPGDERERARQEGHRRLSYRSQQLPTWAEWVRRMA